MENASSALCKCLYLPRNLMLGGHPQTIVAPIAVFGQKEPRLVAIVAGSEGKADWNHCTGLDPFFTLSRCISLPSWRVPGCSWSFDAGSLGDSNCTIWALLHPREVQASQATSLRYGLLNHQQEANDKLTKETHKLLVDLVDVGCQL